MATRAKTPRLPPVRAATPNTGERLQARATTNTWWCPWDDRAMQRKDPCDVCGATLINGWATRP